MEKPQIKMGYGFAADFQPPAVEAKTITHFNYVTLFKSFLIKKALLRTLPLLRNFYLFTLWLHIHFFANRNGQNTIHIFSSNFFCIDTFR